MVMSSAMTLTAVRWQVSHGMGHCRPNGKGHAASARRSAVVMAEVCGWWLQGCVAPSRG